MTLKFRYRCPDCGEHLEKDPCTPFEIVRDRPMWRNLATDRGDRAYGYICTGNGKHWYRVLPDGSLWKWLPNESTYLEIKITPRKCEFIGERVIQF